MYPRESQRDALTIKRSPYHFKAEQHALQPVNLLPQFPDQPNIGILHGNQKRTLTYGNIWIKLNSSSSDSGTATDLINPRLVDDISGMGGVAQGAEGLVVTVSGG